MYTQSSRFNASDLNEIENYTNSLSLNIYTILNINLNLTIKNDWTYSDIPTVEQLERIRSNLEKCAKAIDSTYSIDTFDNIFTYENANDFLNAIDFVFDWLWRSVSVIYFPNCGYYCANEPLYLLATR